MGTSTKYGWDEGISLLKCIYNREDQTQITRQILEMYLVDACGLKGSNGTISKEGLQGNFEYQNHELIKNFKKLAPLFKDNYFQQEQEYRVIATVNSRYQEDYSGGYPIELRSNGTMLVPYYNFTYNKEVYGNSIHWKYLPSNNKDAQPIDFRNLIRSVKLGPCRDQSKAFHSLQLFVRKHIGIHCQVSQSDAPYIY